MLASTGITLALIGICGGAFLLTYRKIPYRLDHIQKINTLTLELFSENIALFDFYFPSSRTQADARWDKFYRLSGQHIEELSQIDAIDQTLIEQLRRAHREIGTLIDEMRGIPLKEELKTRRLADQVMLRLNDMVRNTNMLIAVTQDQLKRAQNRADNLILFAISGICLTALFAASMFDRTILRPISVLKQGAENVGRGILDQRVEVRSDDEIGQLTTMFNQMTENLERLTKAREEFLSTAAHELKTPLSIIKTYVQLMDEQPPGPEKEALHEVLRILNRQCNRMTKLIQDLLEVSRVQLRRMVLKSKPFELHHLIETLTREMQKTTNRHQLRILENVPVIVDGDADRIEQILVNLLDNAIKYSPTGGQINIRSQRRGEQIEVSVQDNGIGIPPDRQTHIFERFYRAHAGLPYDYATSMGIGLYLAHEFVRLHGGQIWFESQEGKGSVFHFKLPAKEWPQELLPTLHLQHSPDHARREDHGKELQ